MLRRPGFHTSEFLVAVATIVLNAGNAWADWTSQHEAAVLSVPAVAFIIARGLAKYEGRGDSTPPAA